MATATVKPFWQSKTFWANAVMGVAAFMPSVQSKLTPEVMGMIFTGVNVVLRFVTKDKITLT